MPEQPATYDLREPAPPEPLLPRDEPPGWVVLLAAVLLAALLLSLWWWLRRAKRTAADPAAERLRAFQDACAAIRALDISDSRAAAVRVSGILRGYLARALDDPSLYETHEEFISRAGSLKALSDSARDTCRSAFDRLAELKYSPAATQTEPAQLANGALQLLETLHSGFKAPA